MLGALERPAGAGSPTERRRRSPLDGRMDNPAGCPRAHPKAVGFPQAPPGPTIKVVANPSISTQNDEEPLPCNRC